ncbi:chromosome segregation protein SMC [Oenococcus kitaharae]|uniref:Chromosome partition protein Smc n=1 Tax=Oenococcus kitaharae DSM 17330 TaxID=1045004 RepID=G9WIG6_9LACO|nr:chromosome segregation protein SMC [Oenococcus kitaharae]EHN58978.1 Chromosome partition protein [Oenococcus kitaharae DSM 17330]OEY81712.1 chromosome segregation protein SMC [Oenococcus kitaharae]OEY83943.1 chromosome segregation protein SMC [Oenococcus kitaharae]OEY85701.1 chromosome segregation protein SMC [Oenococcus kitaharae]
MRLKSLEINGFKSFADKTVIDFMPGMTGIVGPNGSGKSNIIEAIRWVMGEQSAKGLRGSTMSDVIFGGSKNRRALGRAMVTMTIDNSDHFLHTDFDEVQVSRRLYRDGQAEYLINGVKSRLKDITDLFVDTGLGRESFSIINQGKVEEIFNAKAEDRRAIIEDVAGVFKYKQNKLKSQNELAQTQENLARLLDIVKEISDRLQPLKDQAAEAEAFLALRKQFDQLNLVKLVRSRAELSQKEKQFTDDLQQLLLKIQKQEEALKDQDQQQTDTNLRTNGLDHDLLELNRTIETLTQRYEHAIGQHQLQEQKIASLTQNKQNLDEDGVKNTQRLAQLDHQIDGLRTDTAKLQEQLIQAQDAVHNISQELADSGDLTAQDQLENTRSQYLQSMQDAATLSNQLTNLDRDQMRMTSRLDSLNLNRQQVMKEIAEKKQAVNQGKQQDDDQNSDLEAQSQQAQKALNEKKTHLSTLNQKHSDLVSQYNQVRVRVESLQNANENLDLYVGVRNLLNSRNQFPGLFGTVAELIKVAPAYALAIETALGAGLQNIVVDTQETAKNAISFLTERRLGRVTFLPIETIKARCLPENLLQRLDGESEYVGLAADLIERDHQFSAIIENLLGTTVIAENLPAAFRLSKAANQRCRIVTLDGHVVNAGGSITGGANRHQSGLLSKRAELDRLSAQLDQIKQQGIQANQDVLTEQREIAAAEAAFVKLRNQLLADKERLQLQSAQKGLLEESLQQMAKQLKANQLEEDTLKTDLSQAKQNRQSAAVRLQKLQQTNDQLRLTIHRLTDNLADAQSSAHQQNDRLASAREQLAAFKVQKQADEKRLKELDDERVLLIQEQNQQAAKSQTLDQQLQQLQRQIQLSSDAGQASQALKEANDKREQLLVEQSDLKQQADVLRKAISEQQQQLRHLLDQKNQLDSKKSAVVSRLTELDQQLQDLGNPDIDHLDLHSDESLADISRQSAALKEELAKHNSVNLAAIDELKSVQDRYDFLISQRDDLIKASENLQTVMDDIDREVVRRFKKTFDAVAEQFKTTFSELFGGGQGSLELDNPKDLLTSGIEIRVQPPGKKLQRLSLLSGGEKALTAIALLLAILIVHPVPFAILDETEAALDEANVDNFGRFLKDFSNKTQFIVITHRKGTMRYANVLYGVTMQEPGVSTMVSVDLEQAKAALEG